MSVDADFLTRLEEGFEAMRRQPWPNPQPRMISMVELMRRLEMRERFARTERYCRGLVLEVRALRRRS